MSPELVKDFKQLHTFLTTRFYGQQQDPMLPVTAKKYGHYIRSLAYPYLWIGACLSIFCLGTQISLFLLWQQVLWPSW